MINYRIDYDLAALMILVTLLMYFFVKPLRKSYRNNAFTVYFCLAFICCGLDVITVVFGWNHLTVATPLIYFINALYLTIGFIIPVFVLHYAVILVGKEEHLSPMELIPAVVGIVITLVVNPFTGWIFSITSDGTYLKGPYNFLIFISGIFYILVAAIYAIKSHKFIERKKMATILAIVLVNMSFGIIQLFHPEYLLTGMGEALAVVMMYLSFQNFDEETDALTGIPNRVAFYEDTNRLLQKNPQTPYSIITVDIARFKVINEIYGWEVGNAVLKEVGRQIQEKIGQRGTCCRGGADGFLLCAPTKSVTEKALCEPETRLRLPEDQDYNIVFYFGIYDIDDIDLPIDLMCDRAKMALLTVRGNYVHRCAWYDHSLREAVLQEQIIVSEMEEALKNGEFKVLLQPIVSLETGKVKSAEALVRWQHPQRGSISPAQFIPIFERNGFISKLDYNVWEQICAILKDWTQRGMAVIPISVNLSRADFYNPNLYAELTDLLKRYDVSPKLFKLEITESVYMEDERRLTQIVDQFKAFGCEVLMDDFGSGYSSLNALKDIEVDILKIDLAFLDRFSPQARSATILTAVIKMAHALHIPTVAEGIDNPVQMDFLREMGCDYGQGYYFSKPVPREALEGMMEKDSIIPERE